MFHKGTTQLSAGGQRDAPRTIRSDDGPQLQRDICNRQKVSSFFRPLHQLEARAGKDVAKASVLPLPRVIEAVEIEMPDVHRIHLVRLDDGVGRAFDASLHTQAAKQVARQRGFTCAQVSLQGDDRSRQGAKARQLPGESLRRVLIGPKPGFYNWQVTLNSMQFDGNQLVSQIRAWARELGFSQIGVTGVDLSSAEPGLQKWLSHGFHGDMHYMERHGMRRARPAELVPGTASVITARMDYLPESSSEHWQVQEFARLERTDEAVVSLYARGRDYHKVLRNRLQTLAQRIETQAGPLGFRVFTDSAPVLEVELATRSALGWRGKHTLALHRDAGSMFFLGEILVNVALPHDEPLQEHCGSCSACIDICPTQAIVAPYRLDARRCISYLTIEHAGPIPLDLRPLMGNRIYGCDDCQLVCPWNKFARRAALTDFEPREGLTGASLAELFAWSEEQFLQRTEGSAIRRIGWERWLRNIAVALGNALRDAPDLEAAQRCRSALQTRSDLESPLVQEHIQWALTQQPVLE